MATQSAGAGARQLDADFDDDPNNNAPHNGQLGELFALCLLDDNQHKEAQAHSQPIRPNIGTDMIEARQHTNRTNSFLNNSPIELPLQFDSNLLDHAINASHALGDKDNTKRAYDPKRLEFLEFLDYKYAYECVVNRYTVQYNKVYEFICYHAYRNKKNVDVTTSDHTQQNKSNKRKRKRGGSGSTKKNDTKYKYFDPLDFENVMVQLKRQITDGQVPKDPSFGIKDDCLMQYKCAIKQLHQEQVAQERNTNAWEFVWTEKCKKVFTYVKSRRRRVALANCDEKFDYDTIYETQENILILEKAFWTDGTVGNSQSVFSSLRNRFCFLMTIAAILRGESMFKAELSDLYGIEWLGDDVYDQNPFWVLMMQITTGKTNKDNIKLFGRAGRHKDPLQCPMAALGFYLFYRFAKSKEMENTPDFTDPNQWFRIKLLVDYKNGDNTVSIGDRTYGAAIKKHLKNNQIFSANKVHIGRKWGSFKSQLQGDDAKDTQILGNWNPSTQDKSYSVKVPIPIVRSMAGWRTADGLHYNARADVVPPKELVDSVFPWLQGSRDKVFASQHNGNEHPTAHKFLHLMHHLAVCVVQDSAAIMVKYPQRVSHGMFKLPLFHTALFTKYVELMRTSLLHYKSPADATLETVMPGMNNRLNLILSEVRHGRQQTEILNDRLDKYVSDNQDAAFGLHQHFCDSQNSTRTMYAQSLRLLADQLDKEHPQFDANHSLLQQMGTSVQHIIKKSILPVPTQSPLLRSPPPEMGSMVPVGFNHSLEEKHTSVQDMYDEWFGLGKYTNIPVNGGIHAMETEYKSVWRRDFSTANAKRFSRLKNVVKTLLHVVVDNSDGKTIADVILMFNDIYQNDPRKSISKLDDYMVQNNYRIQKKKK
jgi:hypothetical protein